MAGAGAGGQQVHQFRFRALIALDAAAASHGIGQYASPTQALMLRAACLSRPVSHRLFPAEVSWDDHHLLKPGDRAVVTLKVADEDAEMFFAAGQRFTIWNGSDIGHGTISRQIFTTSDTSSRRTPDDPYAPGMTGS
jgi:hypothetical protein